MPPRFLIRVIVALAILVPSFPAIATLAQNEGEVVVVEDSFDDPSAGILQEGSDDPNLRYDYDDDGYEIDAFADDFSGDLTVPVPGDFTDATIAIDAALTGKDDTNSHYLFLECRLRDGTGYKFEVRPLAQIAAIWKLSPEVNQRIANVGLENEPGSGPFRLEFSCEGDQLSGRIDGQEVISVTDDSYDQGSFAFGAGVYKVDAGKVSADFDNLTISVPADEAPATPEASPEAVDEGTGFATIESNGENATPAAETQTAEPVEEATPEPTEAPTDVPTEEPTQEPTPTEAPTEAAASQAATFDRSGLAAAADQLRAQTGGEAPAFGPESGQTDLATGLEVADFVASASFVVPGEGAWSAGYAFRQRDDTSALLIVSSNGAWMLTAGTEQVRAAGLVDSVNTGGGEENAIELIAVGETGYLTVNGAFIAQLDLSTWPDAGDLSFIGAVADAGTPLELFDATVWGLGESAVVEPAQTPTASPVPEVEESATEEPATPEATAASEDDPAATFDDIVALVKEEDPLTGPSSGTLTQAVGSLDIASADVITENFYSTVRFSNPASADDPDHPWDIVIGFWHTGGDDQVRLVISSDGTWSVALGTARPILSGTVDNLNLGAARGNDIELAVSNGIAYLGVNEEFVTSFEVPTDPRAGDIWLASGTFPENAQPGVETPYSDWTIWSLERG